MYTLTPATIPLVVSLLLLPLWSSGQDVGAVLEDVTSIRDQKLDISGGINLNSNFYGASGIDPRRDNFQWGVRANLNFSFLGISAPFSLAFSDANRNFNLPSYTFTGISPTYRWATLHAGDRSMGFSKYSMSGISFRGLGLELRPGKWQVATFYGKLNRALATDLNAVGDLNGFYRRDGYGLKVGYGDQNFSYSLNFFSANDREDETQINDLGDALRPINNKVVSLEGRQRLTKHLSLATEVAHSVFNGDKTSTELIDGNRTVFNTFFGLQEATQSVQTGFAGNLGLFYNANRLGLQLNYERISRGFRTLGALFFNNDTDNLTAGVSYSFLEGKLSTFVNGGLERTNIGDIEDQTTDRVIGSVNVNYLPNDKWSLNTSYSNFRNDTKLRAMTEVARPVDSIFLAQVTQNGSVVVNRRLGSKQRPASLALVLNHQRANSIVNDTVNTDSRSRFTTAALNYSGGVPSAKLRWNAGVSVNFTDVGSISNRALAPTVGLSKSFLNNALSTYLRGSMNFVRATGMDAGDVLNLGLGATYRLKNSHRITLASNLLNRFGAAEASRNFSEYYGQIGYGYNFGGSIGLRRRTQPPVATDFNKKK